MKSNTTKKAAQSKKPTTTRKPAAVKVRRVKGAALAPPVVREPEHLTPGCTPEIDAEAKELFPDLPFVVRTADGKEITGSVMDMRQELYRLRRIKGDTLTTPEEIKSAEWRKKFDEEEAVRNRRIGIVELHGPAGTELVYSSIDIEAAKKYARKFNEQKPPHTTAVFREMSADAEEVVLFVDLEELKKWKPKHTGDIPPCILEKYVSVGGQSVSFAHGFNGAELKSPKGMWAVPLSKVPMSGESSNDTTTATGEGA